MKRSSISMVTAVALLGLLGGIPLAHAQVSGQDPHHPQAGAEAVPAPEAGAAPASPPPERAAEGSAASGMMGQGMMNPQMMRMMQEMMGSGMMGNSMRGQGMMAPGMMRMMVILMDSDGDGALSLKEVQAVHGRFFSAIDADDDGRVSVDELQAFMGGMAAQVQQMPMRPGAAMGGGAASASSQAYMAAMQRMMDGMASMQMTGEPAKDFAMMMIPHHQSAIDMAEVYLQYSDDPELTRLANEIIAAQREEIEFLQRWLEQRQ